MLNYSVLYSVAFKPLVCRPFENHLLTLKMLETPVAQPLALVDNEWPFLPQREKFGQIVEIEQEFLMLFIDLGIAGLEGARPDKGRQSYACPVIRHRSEPRCHG